MSKVKTSKGAVWEGFRAWHVCKTQHARSQMTEVSVNVNCHKWPIMGYTRPRLFKRWIALSTGSITIQRISITQINYAIRWIVIYPVDSAIQRLNNPGQELDIGMRYWNNAHSLLFSISPQPPRSLQATSCNLLFSLSLSLEQAIQNGVFNFLPTWQKIGKNWKKLVYQFIVGTPLLYGWWG